MVKRSQQPVHPPLFKEEQLINPFHGEQGAESEGGSRCASLPLGPQLKRRRCGQNGMLREAGRSPGGRLSRPHGMGKCGTVH